MIRATRPISIEAAKAANDDIYTRHPEMIVDGRRKPIDPCDEKDSKLRNEWMTSYQAHGGKVEKAMGSACAEQLRTAGKQADRYSALVSPTGSVAVCPDRTPPPPDPIKVARAPKPHENKVLCELLSASLSCEHGRIPHDGILFVVPDSYGSIGDKISCKAVSNGGCGHHVEWIISGMWSSREEGNTTNFLAKTFKPALFGGCLGLHRIDPQTYRVSAIACEGGAPMIEVRAYPPDKSGGKIDFEELRKRIKKWLEHAPINDEEKEELEKGWFVGAIEYSQQWKEDQHSYRAFCETVVAGSFDPFFGFKLPPVPIYPLNLVPAPLEKWLKAGVYFSLDGGFSFKVELFWNYWPDDDNSDYEKTEVSLLGRVAGKLSVNLFLVNKDVVNAEVSGQTGLKIGGKFVAETPPAVELAAQWTGLEATVSIKVAWGWVEYSRTYPILKEVDLGSSKYSFDKAAASAYGGD